MGKSYVEKRRDPGYTPNRLINAAMEMLDISRDVEFARLLGVRQSDLSMMRSRNRYISEVYLVKIHDLTGMTLNEMRELMGERPTCVTRS